MNDNRCNGWHNRETWLVSLWFGDLWSADADEGNGWSAEAMEEMVTEHCEGELRNGATGFVWDMLSLGSIDWQELEEHYMPDA